MAVGYAFEALYKKDPAERKRLLTIIGLSAIGLFFGDSVESTSTVIRKVGVAEQGTYLHRVILSEYDQVSAVTFVSINDVGPGNACGKAVFEAGNAKAPAGLQKFFITFGRCAVVLFISCGGQQPTSFRLLLHFAAGKPAWWLFKTPIDWSALIGPDVGFNLVVVYLSWIAGCVVAVSAVQMVRRSEAEKKRLVGCRICR